MSLTKSARDALPADHFAVPGKRKLPIHDATHARLAWDMVERTHGLSPEERSGARSRILKRAKELGVDTQDWHAEAEIRFEAMAIEMPEVADHPNRRPFKGVLTRVDQPSDEPPGGSTGKRVMIPSHVAEAALPTLLGMAIDCDSDGDFNGHDPQFKIGIITGANVVGDAVKIEGFFYANDFPELWQKIQAEKHQLGFSYEVKVRIRDMDAAIWEIDECVFTGAALLYKHRAAYHTTSLAAKSAGEFDMTIEEMKKAIADSIAPLQATIEAQAQELKELKAKGASLGGPIVDQAMPHIAACNAAADSMEAAGIGTHPTLGHAAHLRRVAAHILHAATIGKLPHVYRDHSYLGDGLEAAVDPKVKEQLDKGAADLKAATDSIAALKTELADVKAAKAKEVEPPARKTAAVSANAQVLLNKHGIKLAEGESLTVSNVDTVLAASNVPTAQRIETKLRLMAEGLLTAA